MLTGLNHYTWSNFLNSVLDHFLRKQFNRSLAVALPLFPHPPGRRRISLGALPFNKSDWTRTDLDHGKAVRTGRRILPVREQDGEFVTLSAGKRFKNTLLFVAEFPDRNKEDFAPHHPTKLALQWTDMPHSCLLLPWPIRDPR